MLPQVSLYTPDSLKRLITPSNALTSIILQHPEGLPFAESELLPILSYAAHTLKILKLNWRCRFRKRTCGYDLTGFKALGLLRIDPCLLLVGGYKGKTTYTSHDQRDLAQLLRSRLPPNLKVLLLDSLTTGISPIPDLDQVIFPKDVELMKCLLEQRGHLVPRLKFLFMYYLDNMVEPKELYELAKKCGVSMSGLYATDDINVSPEWLDED